MSSSLQFEFFDRFTPTYEDRRIDFMVDDLRSDTKGGLRFLDVGCGDGSVLEYLARHTERLDFEGVDPAEEYVHKAERRGVRARVGSVFDLPANEKFDRVLMASVLHHVVGETFAESRANSRRAIRNCLDILEPQGRLYIFEPCFEPELLVRIAFGLKVRGVRVFGNRRVGIGHFNIGAPLVAFFGRASLREAIGECGGRIRTEVEVDSSRPGGVLGRHGIGLVVTC